MNSNHLAKNHNTENNNNVSSVDKMVKNPVENILSREKFSENFPKTKVVNKYKNSYDVYIGRPSKYGNPFAITKNCSREEAVQKFDNYLLNNEELLKQLPKLRGKVLACYCAPKECHGDVYVYYADLGVSRREDITITYTEWRNLKKKEELNKSENNPMFLF